MSINLTLGSIGLGAVEERFSIELQKVIENIQDVNTEAEKKRTITITMDIVPVSEGREFCTLETKVVSKLQPYKPFMTSVGVGIDGNGVVHANEQRQGKLFVEKPAGQLKEMGGE